MTSATTLRGLINEKLSYLKEKQYRIVFGFVDELGITNTRDKVVQIDLGLTYAQKTYILFHEYFHVFNSLNAAAKANKENKLSEENNWIFRFSKVGFEQEDEQTIKELRSVNFDFSSFKEDLIFNKVYNYVKGLSK